MSLNRFQEKAVVSAGNVLVTACPGSGKSTVMSHKAARLLNKESGNLVAVTFTKDAAEELKSRIVKQAGSDKVNRIAAGTFHSLCISMCKKAGIKFDLINEQQRQFIFKKIGVYFSENYTAQEVQEIVDRLKCSMNGAFKSDHKEMLDLYQKELSHYGKSDFQDIIIRTVELLEQKKISPINCKWMLVDEAQDMDEWQLEWVLLHAKSGIHCTVVGDDDQAIYAFRGSLGYEGMMKFQRETRATVLTLPTNYRCHSEILMPAAMVIQNNLDRVDKSIKAEKGEGGRIIVESVERVEDEAHRVASELLVARIKHGKTGQWGLLARTNSILDALEIELLEFDLKYKRIGSTGFFESRIGQLYISTLKHLIKPNWLSMQHLMHALKVEVGLLDGSHDFDSVLSKMRSNHKSKAKVERLKLLMESWPSQKNNPSTIEEVADFISSNYPRNKKDESPADSLPNAAKFLNKLSGSLAQKLAHIENMNQHKSDEDVEIHLMTFHASKGLEYDNVWMVGCAQDTIPAPDSPIDDERRLFYVAMTRAKNVLRLTHGESKEFNKKLVEVRPSMFINEFMPNY